jgi:NADH dehydrogenase (ubiquinone) 1 beta subcomplex subunit 8
MLSRRIVAARPLALAGVRSTTVPQFTQRRTALTASERAELADPLQNGGYINPPLEKRSNRDPYADWWDKQDRRNYGEPCHEDHDILGAVSLHDYNHFTPGWGGVLFGTFVVTVVGLCVAVNQVYPDKVSAPKTYPDGLEAELGGKGAVLVSCFLGVGGILLIKL